MLTRHHILRDGLAAGLVGAGAVAGWFLIVDLITGRAFYTPAVLGSAVFFGVRDPVAVTVGLEPVAMYSLLHLFAFLFIGIVVSTMIAEAEKEPQILWLLAEFFVVFEFGFYALVGLFFTPLLASLAWINVALGNLIAAGSMGYVFWIARPGIRARLTG